MAAEQPERIPTWAGQEPIAASRRTEPVSGTASAGYDYGAPPSSGDFNWILWRLGKWVGYFHESVLRASDTLDGSTPYRLSRTRLDYSIGGPLSQVTSNDAVYYFGGERLGIFSARAPAQTFAAASTNYVHLRPRVDPTSRDPEPEILVSTNPSEPGYATVLQVTTGGATVTAVSEVAGVVDGWKTVAPAYFGEAVEIEPATGGPAALQVLYRNSGVAPGVRIAPQAGALQTALAVEAPAAAPAVDASGTTSSNLVSLDQAGTGPALYATKSASSGYVAQIVSTGTAGEALRLTTASGADGLYVEATGGGSPITLAPQALGPSAPNEGAIWALQSGGPLALQYHESGVTRYLAGTQDGPYPASSMTTATSTLAGGSGTTTIASASFYFRNGGVYLLRWKFLFGRTQGTTAIPSVTCRIGGVARSGANARAINPPTEAAIPGTTFSACWSYDEPYTHLGADGFVTVDTQITMSAGTSSCVFTNRYLESVPLLS